MVRAPLTGKPYSPDLLIKDWKSFAWANSIFDLQATVPVFRDLRYTFAMLAIKDKAMDIKALSKILGREVAEVGMCDEDAARIMRGKPI